MNKFNYVCTIFVHPSEIKLNGYLFLLNNLKNRDTLFLHRILQLKLFTITVYITVLSLLFSNGTH